ncbi:hypothetical protein TWF173_000965 [Orbilia oligospora]|nr:hypothetical protein TWF173_000965 [Orbilia oligospora]
MKISAIAWAAVIVSPGNILTTIPGGGPRPAATSAVTKTYTTTCTSTVTQQAPAKTVYIRVPEKGGKSRNDGGYRKKRRAA